MKSIKSKKYWLVKSEGDCYSIDDLKHDKKTMWSGVRSYHARNFLKDMEVGDEVFFYHSIIKPMGIYGIAKVTKKAIPDETQFDKKDEHYDPKATLQKPIWFCPELSFLSKFKESLSLSLIKCDLKLGGMGITRKGDRLSVQPVSETHFNYIKNLL